MNMDTSRFTTLFRDDEGVSPVIGVILMVAVTVILAAVIGAFVMNMGDNLSQSAPQANFQFEYDAAATSLTVTHAGGDSFTDKNTKKLVVQVAGTDTTWVNDGATGTYPVAAGDSISVSASNGDEVRVIWTSDNGQSTQTVAQYTV